MRLEQYCGAAGRMMLCIAQMGECDQRLTEGALAMRSPACRVWVLPQPSAGMTWITGALTAESQTP